MNNSFPGREGVFDEITTKYHFLRHVSDLGHFSGEKHGFSRVALQIQCWFLDNNPLMYHADQMGTSFPGREGVSDEITAKCIIFDDFSDLAISAAHRDGFCERMCPCL